MKDFQVNIRIQLAGLWTAATLCYLYGDYFELYTPGKIDSLLNGDNVLNTPVLLFIASLIMVIPPLMVVGSLLLASKPNRWCNIIFGSLFTLIMILIAIGSLTAWYGFYVFLAIVESFLTGLIVWTAIRWPKEKFD